MDRQDSPQGAVFPNDSFVLVWESWNQDEASSISIFGQRFDSNGTAIGYGFQANNYTTGNQLNPTVAALANYSFVVSWDSDGQDNGITGVYGQRFDANDNQLGSEFKVHTSAPDTQDQPHVIALPDDQFLAAWRNRDSNQIVAQLFSYDADKIGQDFQVTETTANSQSQVVMTAFPSQNLLLFVFAENSGDGNSYGVVGQFWELTTPNPTAAPTPTPTVLEDAGQIVTKNGDEILINTIIDGIQQNPDAATFSDGRYVVVWEENSREDDNSFGIYGQFLCPDGSWEGIQFHINDNTTDDQLSPQVAVNQNNNTFMVTWRDMTQNSGGQGIYFRLYDSDKVSIAGENLVSESLVGHQSAPPNRLLSRG